MKIQFVKTWTRTLALLLIGLPITMLAQEFATRWVPVNPSARSSALGRMSVMDNGSSALFHNPAALGHFEQLTIGGYASLNTLSQTSGHLGSLSSSGKTQTTALKAPLNLSVIYPFPDLSYDYVKMAYGIGYSRYFQWVDEHSWSFQEDESDYDRVLAGSPGVDVIHVGAGARMWDRFSVGMTVHYIPSGDYHSRDVIYIDDVYKRGFAQTYTTESVTFVSTGMLLTVADSLDIGFSITAPFEWSTKNYWTSENTILREHTLYKAPLSLGYGLTFTKGLIRINYEGNINHYSNMELDDWPIDVEDGIGNRLGLEYTWNTTKIRTGFYADKLPATNGSDQAPVPISGITFGAGFPLGKLTVDVAVDHYSWTSEAFMNSLLAENGDYEDKISGNIFLLELNYLLSYKIQRF
ncbi:MAG: hypothetical protein U9Q77_06225 [Candidatus Marinimicrobia bacterium]|nr:hypothetical protein [Candidatus Neomarinimicrobiota bacterium]